MLIRVRYGHSITLEVLVMSQRIAVSVFAINSIVSVSLKIISAASATAMNCGLTCCHVLCVDALLMTLFSSSSELIGSGKRLNINYQDDDG